MVDVECDDVENAVTGVIIVVVLISIVILSFLSLRLCLSFKDETKDHAITTTSTANKSTELRTERILKTLFIISTIGAIILAITGALRFIFICFINNQESLFVTLGSILTSISISTVYISLFCIFVLRFLYSFQDTSYASSNLCKFYYLLFIILAIIGIIIAVVLISIDYNLLRFAFIIFAIIMGIGITNIMILLTSFIIKLSKMIESFVNEFGRITTNQLNCLNRAISQDFRGKDDEQNDINVDIDFAETKKSSTQKTIEIDETKTKELELEMETKENNDDDDKNKNVMDTCTVTDKDNISNMRKLGIMINLMSKYTILIIIANISSMIYGITLGISSVLTNDLHFRMISIILAIIDTTINVLCLYLQFNFNRKHYKLLCSKWHRLCESRYTQQVNMALIKNHEKTNDKKFNDTVLQLKRLSQNNKQNNVNDNNNDEPIIGITRIKSVSIDGNSVHVANNNDTITTHDNQNDRDNETNKLGRVASIDMQAFSRANLE